MNQMNWDSLICDMRLGLEHYHDNKDGVRSDFERDFDRLVFSSPFRRLQNKTQVFPLPGSSKCRRWVSRLHVKSPCDCVKNMPASRG